MTLRGIRAALRRLRYIRGFPFHPATVHVRRGGRITWLNCGTATTISTIGTFSYRCERSPFMTGTAVVE